MISGPNPAGALAESAPSAAGPGLSAAEELRFSRLLLLPEVTESALLRLRQSRILMIGAGGLGCPAAQYLVSAGIGQLTWLDGDLVSESNLPRQILFGTADLGQPKVSVGAARLRALNPDCRIIDRPVMADAENLPQAIAQADLVLDCSDRYATRQLVNRLCQAAQRPLVMASVVQWSGQLMVIQPGQTACYACVFDPGAEADADAACGAFGVFPTAAGLLGLYQAHEALRLLLGLSSDEDQLRLIDTRSLSIDTIRLSPRQDCPVCSEQARQNLRTAL